MWWIYQKLVGCLEKSMELDESWNNGALYSAMISFTMSRPDAVKNREQLAREYFNKAVEASAVKIVVYM